MINFDALNLSALLLRALDAQDFSTPTEIQASAIPQLMQGRDLLGLAETGSGKTAAFLLPLMNRLLEEPAATPPGAPRALILAPTRELAIQIGAAIDTLAKYTQLKSTVIYGGAPFGKQFSKLKRGLDILVATPGRLMDHERRGSVVFDQTEMFILDEADRMLDMGFIQDVKTIAGQLPDDHQTVLFSATMNKAVSKLAAELLQNPAKINIERKTAVSTSVEHQVMHVSTINKKALLKKLLTDGGNGQVIVFTKTKYGADKLSRALSKSGLKTDAIHGDRNQRQRQRTLTRFREGVVDILIATDVAARGIDVPGIERVINFDLPMEPEAYIHRVGRTGRNGAAGRAVSLCTPIDVGLLRGIERLLKESINVDADHDFHAEPPAKSPMKKKSGGKFKSRRFAGPKRDGGASPEPRKGANGKKSGGVKAEGNRPGKKRPGNRSGRRSNAPRRAA